MNDLLQWLQRFGRPSGHLDLDKSGHDLDAMDGRIENLEDEQGRIAARLRLLEIAADPRGRRKP